MRDNGDNCGRYEHSSLCIFQNGILPDKKMKLRFLATAMLLTTMGLAPARPSFSQTDLNAQLNQALCAQNWAQAIDIVEQMKVAAPEYAGELTVYMSQLQGLLQSKTTFSDWDTGCSPSTSNSSPAPSNTSPATSSTSPVPSNTSPVPSSTSPAPSNTSPTPGDISQQPSNVYPPQLIQDFMEGCVEAGGAGSQPICTCAIEQIQKKYDLGEFLEISGDLLNGGPIPEQLVKIAQSCVLSS